MFIWYSRVRIFVESTTVNEYCTAISQHPKGYENEVYSKIYYLIVFLHEKETRKSFFGHKKIKELLVVILTKWVGPLLPLGLFYGGVSTMDFDTIFGPRTLTEYMKLYLLRELDLYRISEVFGCIIYVVTVWPRNNIWESKLGLVDKELSGIAEAVP